MAINKKIWKLWLLGMLMFATLNTSNVTVLADENTPGILVFDGNGTIYDPYLISTYEDLRTLNEQVDSGNSCAGVYFKQSSDIVVPDGENWDPIGEVTKGYAFSGYYDGRGHTLSNVNCDDPFAGVFSYLDGQVWNLGIESGNFRGGALEASQVMEQQMGK